MKITLRDVKKSDWDYILKLRNEKSYRKNFVHQHTITLEEHTNFLNKQEKNLGFFNQIICYNNKDVGYIRILDNDVGIIIEKQFQNKGIGVKALLLIESKAKDLGIKKLVARIFIQNETSKKIFEDNKYELKMYWYEKNI